MRKLQYEEIKSTRPSLDEAKEQEKFPISVMLENIRSLYNVGAVFRTSDGAGIDTLYLCGYTGYPPRKELDKTSLGSVESVNWERYEDPLEAVEKLKAAGVQIVALEHTDKSVPYTEADYRFPLCLVLGNEVEGISEELVAACDIAVEIPMHGIKQSLNVSVAQGIMTFHLVEKYLEKKNQG
ncbi:MAG: RNA methyltransferase [bacterium]|nr:RNA methyltransferase [bacterium]